MGAEFETVEQAVPGTGHGAANGPATEKGDRESPESEADLDKAHESTKSEKDERLEV